MTAFRPLADPGAFHANARHIVADASMRQGYRSAMDFLVDKRAAQFPDRAEFENLQALGRAIRQHALAHLPDLLVQLERRLSDNGVRVHWAEDADDANRIFLAIARQHDADLMVKGKSMVSEEIGLNHRMAEHGVDCVETDMGEYILQLDDDRPSHIIMPAIHKTKADVAAIFERGIPGAGYTEDVEELIATGRRALRDRFREATIGVSGVNFLVAETGSLVLVENEGNGRLCTSVPEVHIAITGIEKVIARMDQLPPLFRLLTRSATGQAVTTYLNIINGPRRQGERDGARELHLILLDNGRSQAWAEPAFRETLQCIRCGACMNHCPVYARVGGLAYGTTYPGPIGAIVSPHMMGLSETRDLPTASSLCGACAEVCPVGIPIPDLLMRLREAARHDRPAPGQRQPLRGQGSAGQRLEALAWRLWAAVFSRPRLYRWFTRIAGRLRRLTPSRQGPWTRTRTPIRSAPYSLHELVARRQQTRRGDPHRHRR